MGLRNALIVGGMVIVLGGAGAFFHQNNMLKKLAQENVEQKLLNIIFIPPHRGIPAIITSHTLQRFLIVFLIV